MWLSKYVLMTVQTEKLLRNVINQSRHGCNYNGDIAGIVGKKWEPGNLVPSRFLGQIRKVEARLGKLAKIRKVETN